MGEGVAVGGRKSQGSAGGKIADWCAHGSGDAEGEQQKGGAGMNRELAKLQFFGAGPKAAVFDPDARAGKKSISFSLQPYWSYPLTFIA